MLFSLHRILICCGFTLVYCLFTTVREMLYTSLSWFHCALFVLKSILNSSCSTKQSKTNTNKMKYHKKKPKVEKE